MRNRPVERPDTHSVLCPTRLFLPSASVLQNTVLQAPMAFPSGVKSSQYCTIATLCGLREDILGHHWMARRSTRAASTHIVTAEPAKSGFLLSSTSSLMSCVSHLLYVLLVERPSLRPSAGQSQQLKEDAHLGTPANRVSVLCK